MVEPILLKPFELFCRKKFKSDDGSDGHDEQARAAWSALSAKKQTKFIQKCEANYDAAMTDQKVFRYFFVFIARIYELIDFNKIVLIWIYI